MDVGFGVGDRQRCAEKSTGHDQQVKERVDPVQDLPVCLDQLLQSPVDGLRDVIAAVVEHHPEEISAVLDDLVFQVFRHGLAGLVGRQDEDHSVHEAGQGDPVGRRGGRGGVDQDEIESLLGLFPEFLDLGGKKGFRKGRRTGGGRIDMQFRIPDPADGFPEGSPVSQDLLPPEFRLEMEGEVLTGALEIGIQ